MFWEGGDEDYWDVVVGFQDVVDCIDVRVVVGKLDVGQNKFWFCFCVKFYGFCMGVCDVGDCVVEFFYYLFDVQCDEWFVFDDYYICDDLFGDLLCCFVNEMVEFCFVDIQDCGGIGV